MASTSRFPVDSRDSITSRKPALRVAVFFIFVALATLALAPACGGGMMGAGMHEQMQGGGSQVPQTPVISGASQVTVEISNFDFFPRDLTVQEGSTVTWFNSDAAPHDATDVAGGWGTGTLTPGEGATLTFESQGAYQYLCTIHPNMNATLTVV